MARRIPGQGRSAADGRPDASAEPIVDPRTQARPRAEPAPGTPGEAVTERIADRAEVSREARRPKQLLLAFAAGAYVTFGVAFAVTVSNGIPWDGLERLLFGLAFSSGFVMVFIGEGLLATELHAALPLVMYREVGTWGSVGRSLGFWALVLLGNALGTLFVAYLVSASSTLEGEPMKVLAEKVAKGLRYREQGAYGWYAAVLNGVAGNWLVGLAAFIVESSHTTTGKIVGVLLPVATFEALGFEHMTSSMGFYHIAILSRLPVSYGEFLGWNLAPVTLGNIIGGALFVGSLYYYTHVVAQDRRPE